jgi:hypothetical protein
MNELFFAARIILGGFFMYKGIRHFIGPGTEPRAGGIRAILFPGLNRGLTGLTLILGGLCFVFAFFPFYGIVWSGSIVTHNVKTLVV